MSGLETRMVLTDDQINILVKKWGMDDIDRCIQNMSIALAESARKLEEAERERDAYKEDLDRLTRGTWSKEIARLQQQLAEARKQIEAARETCCHPAGDCFDAALEASREK